MRKLNTGDAFCLARIVKNSDLKNDIIDIYSNQKGKTQDEIGLNLIFSLIGGISDEKSEKEVYKILAGVTDKTAKEIQEMELEQTISLLKQIIEENNLADFFKQVSRLI